MAGVFVGVCEWPRRARASRRGHGVASSAAAWGLWDVEPSYASYEASLPGIVTRSYEIVRGELAWEGEAGRVYRHSGPWREGKHGGALDSQL